MKNEFAHFENRAAEYIVSYRDCNIDILVDFLKHFSCKCNI